MPERSEFDEVLLSRARLGILSALASGDEMDFVYLREALELTDGNLGAQIRNLEGKVTSRCRSASLSVNLLQSAITSTGRDALIWAVQAFGGGPQRAAMNRAIYLRLAFIS
jgi:hypothetical protein